MKRTGQIKNGRIEGFKEDIHINFFCFLKKLHRHLVRRCGMHELSAVTVNIGSAAAYESVKSDRLKTFFQVVKTASGIDKH